MPRTKRAKIVSLTETKKKGLEFKQKIIENLREYVDEYARVFTFSVHNMRNSYMKDIRIEWRHSRFFLGKNSCIRVSLGRSPEDEYKDNLHKLSETLVGQMGLLFTNKSKEDVLSYFQNFTVPDFARSGYTSTQTVVVSAGELEQFTHAMEPHLRKLGVPTILNKGIVTITQDYTVCTVGETLSPDQANLLKLFGLRMMDFGVTIEGCWSNEGIFEKFTTPAADTPIRPKLVLKPEDIIPPAGKKDTIIDIIPKTTDMSDGEEDMESDDEEED